MIRIGMIGADSSHTEAYSKLMNLPGSPYYGRAQVVKIWSEDAAQTQQKAKELNIPEVVNSPLDALKDVDMAMIEHRYGDDHPPYARMAIEAGLPTFVDKPFANDLESTRQVVELAKSKNVPLASFSAIRFAPEILEMRKNEASFGKVVSAYAMGPAVSTSIFGPRAAHPFFYRIHGIETLQILLGAGAESVTTRRTSSSDLVLVSYADGRQGIANLLYDNPIYYGAIYGDKGWGGAEVTSHGGYYVEGLERIITLGETGKPPFPADWITEAIAMLTAAVRSGKENGREIRLSEL